MGSAWDLEISELNRLLSRPWFRRAWIVEEIGAAEHVEVWYGRTTLQ